MTLRLTNPARIDGNADRVCAVSYKDKKDKYRDRGGLTLPRVD